MTLVVIHFLMTGCCVLVLNTRGKPTSTILLHISNITVVAEWTLGTEFLLCRITDLPLNHLFSHRYLSCIVVERRLQMVQHEQ